MELAFTFTAKVWLFSSEKSSWHFVTMPQDQSDEIKFFSESTIGFGSKRVKVTIGDSTWKTSLFPSKELAAYVLPIKANIRKAENIKLQDEITVSLEVL